jgi:hypothetical protein
VYGTCLIFKDINGATCKLRHQMPVMGILFSRRYSYDVVNEYVNIDEGKVYILYESLSGSITCMLRCTFLCRHAVMNRDGSDSLVTVCRIGDRGFDSKKRVFSLPSRLDCRGFSPSAYREVFPRK